MTDPQVFYNREDVWDFPSENSGEEKQVLSPMYMLTRVPGEAVESYVMMLPFTPSNKNNMVAWMAARVGEGAATSEVSVFLFPKDRTIYGPMQIESRIDQDTEISQSLTLWGQAGSRVIRGALTVVPVGNALLYVEPVYLQATQGKLPELKRVVVAYQDQVVMSESLPGAISRIFSGVSVSPEPSGAAMPVMRSGVRDRLIRELADEYAVFKQSSAKIDRLVKALSSSK